MNRIFQIILCLIVILIIELLILTGILSLDRFMRFNYSLDQFRTVFNSAFVFVIWKFAIFMWLPFFIMLYTNVRKKHISFRWFSIIYILSYVGLVMVFELSIGDGISFMGAGNLIYAVITTTISAILFSLLGKKFKFYSSVGFRR